ncbi:MAG: Ni/Fe hydrogenase subunit alpha [Deltaproteobacteria bacterium]|nr:Ni/Fe hydrogenase subunit alpha [Deltaproteobacteria bacterium]
MSKEKTPKANKTRTIRVGPLARVEGEGALHLVMTGRAVEEVRLEIFEPPRFYEAFLKGRDFMEVPDITARICGICPVAYQTASCYALEKAMGVFDQMDPPLQKLRDLIYCGEWIESHVLHMFMLHLPDFLGYESAVSMARDHGEIVRRALRIKKAGNAIVELLGGRSVHPVGMCVGGFYSCPEPEDVASLLPEIKACLADMKDLALFLAQGVSYPDFKRDYEFVALCPDDEYPMNLGRIKSNKGLDVNQEAFGEAIEERQVSYSTALFSAIKGRGDYLVGPLARLNLNHEKLHPVALDLLKKVCAALKEDLPWNSSFLSLPARAVETVHALAVAGDILQSYGMPSRCRIPITPRAGYGGHGTEAPRGICWHDYRTEKDGTISFARIMPPTAQNQMCLERDLYEVAKEVVDLTDEAAAMRCEQLIRNYDPCISCSVHFLKFERTYGENSGNPP